MTRITTQDQLHILRAALAALEAYPEPAIDEGYRGGYDLECINYAYGYLLEAEAYLQHDAQTGAPPAPAGEAE
ncbi:MAG TPA: hypothetical protein PKD55_00910 [Bellilinea sp.]|nr:hypothetical protein [Bellilinea sp.]